MEISPTMYLLFLLSFIIVVVFMFLGFFIFLSSVNKDKMGDNAKESWIKIGIIFRDTIIFIYQFCVDLLKSVGDLINTSSNVSTIAIKYSADFLNSIAHDIGNLFKGVVENTSPPTTTTESNPKNTLDETIQKSPTINVPSPEPNNEIKTDSIPEKWCFIGIDEKSQTVCVPLKKNQGCHSNRIYSSAQSCNSSQQQ